MTNVYILLTYAEIENFFEAFCLTLQIDGQGSSNTRNLKVRDSDVGNREPRANAP